MKFKTPAKRLPGTNLVPLLPESCSTTAIPTFEREGTGVVERYAVTCNASLAGARVGIRGLEASQTDALLRVELADGRHIQSVLRSSEPSLVIPDGRRGSPSCATTSASASSTSPAVSITCSSYSACSCSSPPGRARC